MRQLLDKPSPITGGPLELCVSPATGNFRGETIPYQKTYYHCVESDMEFADSEMEANGTVFQSVRCLSSWVWERTSMVYTKKELSRQFQ